MDGLSDEVIARADRSANGEYAWTRLDAIVVTRLVAAAGYALLGGELWIFDGDGILGGIPSSPWNPEPPLINSWSFSSLWDPSTEIWEDYCRRAADYTMGILETSDDERYFEPRLRSQIRYNLTWVSRDEEERFRRSARSI